MLTLPPSTRVFVATKPADMRRSFDGLLALVRDFLGHEDPLSGHLFVFRNKSGDRLKVIWWDIDGLAIFYKNQVSVCTPSLPFTESIEHSHNLVEQRPVRLLLLFAVVLGLRQRAELVVPVRFQSIGDQTIARIDLQVATLGEVGLVAGAFDLLLPQSIGIVESLLQFVLDGKSDFQGHERHHLQKQLADGVVDAARCHHRPPTQIPIQAEPIHHRVQEKDGN